MGAYHSSPGLASGMVSPARAARSRAAKVAACSSVRRPKGENTVGSTPTMILEVEQITMGS